MWIRIQGYKNKVKSEFNQQIVGVYFVRNDIFQVWT